MPSVDWSDKGEAGARFLAALKVDEVLAEMFVGAQPWDDAVVASRAGITVPDAGRLRAASDEMRVQVAGLVRETRAGIAAADQAEARLDELVRS